ncbi:hypothetical protein JW979_03300 [bacterium]|nr:hypothetical protein [candidate division CSSED10-310 bacterium]
MTERPHLVSVFLASPGDVSNERLQVEKTINEMNIWLKKLVNVQFELIKWETHTYPGVGEDAQDVINKQVSGTYQVFIGILWSRIGSQTKRADSGTVEEFQIAYKRYCDDPRANHIMFYFKDKPIPPSQIVPDQIAEVQNFKKKISISKGVYYREFNESDELCSLMRIGLSSLIADWRKNKVLQLITEREDEDEGFIELMEAAMENMKAVKQDTERIVEITQDLNKVWEERTRDFDRAKNFDGSINLKFSKTASNNLAADFKKYVTKMEEAVPLFSDHLSKALQKSLQSVIVLGDYNYKFGDELRAFSNILESVEKHLIDSQKSNRFFRDRVANLPRLTTNLNRAKKSVTKTLDAFYEEKSTMIGLITELQTFLQKYVTS